MSRITKKLFKFSVITLFAIMILLSGCEYLNKNRQTVSQLPELLEEIAYDAGSSWDYRLYLREEDQYISYLVLTNNYNGNCLLLRENLIDDDNIYNLPGDRAAYYENSEIDRYLNEVFIVSLPNELQQLIVDSEIIITARESLGVGGEETLNIQRKIFLLSYTELTTECSRTNLKEGQTLSYFDGKEKRIAYYQNGIPGSWWLRTANTSGRAVVCGVSAEGVVGMGGFYDPNAEKGNLNGVRPALCLPRDIEIYQSAEDGRFYIRENAAT